MTLHKNKKLFSDAIRTTAEQKEILDIYVEKDYWVTYALYTIFKNEIGKDTIFKGGTALSKCFGLVERFSEDIDLVVRKRKGESNNQLTNKIRKISKIVSDELPEIKIENITNKRGMNRKTAHIYSKEFSGEYGQIRDVIVVEATWLGSSEPFVKTKVSSLVYEMMLNNRQLKIAEEYGLLPFEIQALEPKRTFCEKIMSLVRFSYTENPIENLKNKVRHTYDLNLLLKNEELSKFFESDEFDKMLLKVASDDVESFKNNNAWLQNPPKEAKIFAELKNVWEELKSTYTGGFSNLVFGELPSEKEIYETLKSILERLESVDWIVTIENPK